MFKTDLSALFIMTYRMTERVSELVMFHFNMWGVMCDHVVMTVKRGKQSN